MIAHATFRARRRSVALAALLALAWSEPALAQTQLYLLTSGTHAVVPDPNCQPWDLCEINVITNPGRVILIDVDRRTVASIPVLHTHGTAIGPGATPDGRFLLWSGWNLQPSEPYRVSLFEIAGRQQVTPFSAFIASESLPLAVHPTAMRAFLSPTPTGPLIVAEPDNTYALPVPPCAQPYFSGLSGDGRRLSYFCGNPRSVMVVDSGDGRLLGAVTLFAPVSQVVIRTPHALDGPGTTMYAVDMDNPFPGNPVWYRRFDVATGALLAERQSFEAGTSLWAYNEMTGHLYAGSSFGIVVLDANTLAEVGRIARPHPALFPKVAFDPDQPHAYIAWYSYIGGPMRVSLVHTGTLATLASIDIPVDGQLVGIALGPRPPRVSDLSALVGGGLVTLSWAIGASRSIATGQVVEAGFSPGETVVRRLVDAGATSLTVPGVPPGRYYVRVRSENGTGIGMPSNEVVVDVP